MFRHRLTMYQRFAFGATEDEARDSLELLDRTVQALRVCVVDDVHISNTIANTLQSLITSIRSSFLRFTPGDRGPKSESRDRTPQHSRQETPYHPEQNQDQHAQRGQGASTNPFGYNFDHTQGNYHDPLAGIPAQPINLNLGVSFMPPPPSMYPYFGTQNMSNGNSNAAQAMDEGVPPDWFALPLDTLFNSAESAVDQGFGGIGPMVGDSDMLDMILNGQYDNLGAASATLQGQNQSHGQYHGS